MGKIANALKKIHEARKAGKCKGKISPELADSIKRCPPVGGGKRPKTVIKALAKPKVLEQTPTGMANSTKSSPYIPPAKKTTKPNL